MIISLVLITLSSDWFGMIDLEFDQEIKKNAIFGLKIFLNGRIY